MPKTPLPQTPRFLALLTTLLLCACGFQPVYGTYGMNPSRTADSAVSAALAQIEIGNIPDRSGLVLRNALIDRFYKSGRPIEPTWTLNLSPISETLTDLDITRDSDSTRTQIRLKTDLVLKEKSSGKTLLTRRIDSVTSYNVLGSEFATRVTREDARTNALSDLARQIEQELALYFSRIEQ